MSAWLSEVGVYSVSGPMWIKSWSMLLRFDVFLSFFDKHAGAFVSVYDT